MTCYVLSVLLLPTVCHVPASQASSSVLMTGSRPRSSRRGKAAEQLGFVVSESGQIWRGRTNCCILCRKYQFTVFICARKSNVHFLLLTRSRVSCSCVLNCPGMYVLISLFTLILLIRSCRCSSSWCCNVESFLFVCKILFRTRTFRFIIYMFTYDTRHKASGYITRWLVEVLQ